MSIVRVKPDVASVVFDEKTGGFVTLGPHQPFDSADPIVKANKWAFETETEAFERDAEPGRITSVNIDNWVEQTTAAPGEKRNARRGEKHAAPTSERAADLDVIAAPEANNPEAFADDETDPASPGPITSNSWGSGAKAGDAPSLDAKESKVDAKAAAAKGRVPAKVGKATSNATPRVVKKG